MTDPVFLRLIIKQGEDFALDLDFRSEGSIIDTTGWVGISSLQTLDGANPYDLVTQQLIALSTTFPSVGTMRLTMPAVKTVKLPAKRYLIDVKIIDSMGKASYYLDGDVIVRRSYTP